MSQTDAHYQLPAPNVPSTTRVLIVRAPYYKAIGDDLLQGAQEAIKAAGASFETIDVPGALEIPTAIAIAANSNKFDGFVALGCVIRGETTHYETVCNDSSRALTLLGLQNICLGNGILTVENMEQAAVRSDPKGQNKGGGAAEAALHLIAAKNRFGQSTERRSFGFLPDSEHFDIASKD